MLRWFVFLLTATALIAQPPTSPPPAASPVRQWMSSLSLRDRIAQLITMACVGEAPSTKSADYRKFQHWVRDLRIGGLIVNNRIVGGQVRNAEPYAVAVFLNRMQKLARVPLIIQGDFERGASMRIANTTRFPHNMAYGASGDLEASHFEGAETARQARALGFHWIFAPDADVNNNPDNPIINTRSYGEDPQTVAQHVVAYIQGARSDPKARVLVTVKHFPGHGDTDTDSHLGLARIPATRERIEAVELVPFRAAIRENVDAVMTAHLAVPALEPEEIPATLSKNIMTGLLRQQLGFKGLIVTDAMDMQGLTKAFGPGEASVRAIEAGVDMLIMPTDPEAAIKAILRAIESGRLTRRRIDESVSKVLAAKVKVGLHRQRLTNVELLSDTIDNPDAEERAQAVANHAITLVKNEREAIPLADPAKSVLIVLTETRWTQQGRQFVTEARQRAPGLQIRILDPSTPQAELLDTAELAGRSNLVVVAAFINAREFKGNLALPGEFTTLLKTITDSGKPVALVAFGNPYLLRSFPGVAAYMASFSSTTTSETAAVKALFGEISIQGRLPVSIPGYAKIGDGIQVPVRITTQGATKP